VSEQPQYNEKTAVVEDAAARCFIVRMFAAHPPMALQKDVK